MCSLSYSEDKICQIDTELDLSMYALPQLYTENNGIFLD